MALGVMQMVWDSTEKAPERFTLLALADRADEDGKCWPSIPTLARKCATSQSTIRRHLSLLEEGRLLTVQRRFNNSSIYTISLPRLRELAWVDPRQSDTPSQSDRGSQSGGRSQSAQSPPPKLHVPPSQSERLSLIDTSVDPSLFDAQPSNHDEPGTQLAVVHTLRPAVAPTKEVAVADLKASAQVAVAAWVDAYTAAHDAKPTGNRIGQAGRECKALLKAGNPPERVTYAASQAGAAGFATVEREYQMLARRNANRTPAAQHKPSTTDARVEAARLLTEQIRRETS